jgi:hypothetical protein
MSALRLELFVQELVTPKWRDRMAFAQARHSRVFGPGRIRKEHIGHQQMQPLRSEAGSS